MIQNISKHCLENNILLGDYPKFVENIMKTAIPFSMGSKASRELKFDYESELSTNRKKLDSLPEKISKTIYEFQREGINYGIQKFGRMLFGDEMGVGKTV